MHLLILLDQPTFNCKSDYWRSLNQSTKKRAPACTESKRTKRCYLAAPQWSWCQQPPHTYSHIMTNCIYTELHREFSLSVLRQTTGANVSMSRICSYSLCWWEVAVFWGGGWCNRATLLYTVWKKTKFDLHSVAALLISPVQSSWPLFRK